MNLNLVSVLNGSGYGLVGLNLLRALTTAGHEVALFARDQDGFPLKLELDDLVLVRAAIKRQAGYDLLAPCLRLASEFDMGLFAGRGPRCGLSFFETDRFTPRELHHLNSLDYFWVPSRWALEVAASQLQGPRLAVVPMGVDTELFHPSPAPAGEDTVFLHVGKWEHRKGQDFLLRAFEQAFHADDRVRLRLLSHNPFLGDRNSEWQQMVRSSPLAARIECLPRLESLGQLAEVMGACHCGVFPSRSEGWNLELLEMMACARPVIATHYAGHSEFANAENCRLIQVDQLEPARDDRWMTLYSSTKTGSWARLGPAQLEQLVLHLREVHQQHQSGGWTPNLAGLKTARQFSWTRSAAAVTDALTG